MAEPTGIPSNAGHRRRSQRVLMQLSVRIYGVDAQGKSFDEECDTLAINAHGALVLLQARVTSGSLLMLRNNTTKEEQECNVAFLGPVRGKKAEVGLEFSARRPQFWRVAFPPEDWSPKNPEARTATHQPRPVQK
jgi:hypothetical protein